MNELKQRKRRRRRRRKPAEIAMLICLGLIDENTTSAELESILNAPATQRETDHA